MLNASPIVNLSYFDPNEIFSDDETEESGQEGLSKDRQFLSAVFKNFFSPPPLLTELKKLEDWDADLIKIFDVFCNHMQTTLNNLPIEEKSDCNKNLAVELHQEFINKNTERTCELFTLFLNDPLTFIKKVIPENEATQYVLENFSFYECACAYFDRAKMDERQKAEALIVEGIEFSRADKKDKTLKLTFLGSGGLLQELIIVGKLIQRGFRQIEINFVELNINKGNAVLFCDLLKIAFGVNINFICSISPAFSQSHAVIAVDLAPLYRKDGSAWKLFSTAHATLTKKGMMYVFSKNKNAYFMNAFGMINLPFEKFKMRNSIFKNEVFLKDKKIKIIVQKGDARANFNLPYIAETIQTLASLFKSKINVHLCSNLVFKTDDVLSLDEAKNVLERLANVTQISIKSFMPIPDKREGHIYIYQGSSTDSNFLALEIEEGSTSS